VWGIFAGISIFVALYPVYVDWEMRRAEKKRLSDMRKHVAMGHRWDPIQGKWLDNEPPPLS
jgi:hypothetical protein